jgi:hypothetical protein
MRRSLSALCLALALTPSAPTISAENSIYTNSLHPLFDSKWEPGQRLSPTMATCRGDHRYDARWPDLSPAAAK